MLKLCVEWERRANKLQGRHGPSIESAVRGQINLNVVLLLLPSAKLDSAFGEIVCPGFCLFFLIFEVFS